MIRAFYPFVVAMGFLSVYGLYYAGLSYQRGAMELGQAFGLLRYSAMVGIASAALAIFCLLVLRPKGIRLALLVLAAVAGLGAFYMPYRQSQIAQQVPPIHDITTDWVNPPAFVDVLPLRATAPNPPDYAGEEIASQQLSAYPDIRTLGLSASPEQVFTAAVQLVTEQFGWALVAQNPLEGRIEATVTTRWFGFKDDAVIRIQGDGQGGSVFDMRSKSRVGRSDIGANAARIRAFMQALQAELAAS